MPCSFDRSNESGLELYSLRLAEHGACVMIFLWLSFVVLLSFAIFSMVLLWSRLESGLLVSVLCLLQSVADRFDVYSDRAHPLHRS